MISNGVDTLSDHIGEIYRPYIIVGIADEKNKRGEKLYKVHCMFCDAELNMRLIDLQRNRTCFYKCNANHLKNGIKDRRLQEIFNGMKRRCYKKSDKDYKDYGAKGIGIYVKWLQNPSSFEEWALNNGYESNLTIDRIDPSVDYSPSNCRWITRQENSRYKSTTIPIVVDGIQLTGRQWADKLEIGTNIINKVRRIYGEDIAVELIRQMLQRKPNVDVFCKNNQSWLDAYGIIH